ncbi:Septum formation protein Maf [hydrothermal vent metagenome]|uniref:Septum formation protein Maf n=1 Tax=hydrothermal vent metagenome TaxID=652676 RepID=A0A3B0SFA8_9ZZZZ
MALILASSSPRRSLLLSAAGLTFTVDVPDVDESPLDLEPPAEYVLRLSAAKAHAIARNVDDVVLGADTTVVLDGATIGKPRDAADALEMLLSLEGRTHSVLTGWTVIRGESERFGVEESLVTFHHRSRAELRDYVARTEPLDKAGAYALQGDDGWLVERVAGSRANVMGLPIREVVDALANFGVDRSASQG